jgi:hypothetical protein
MTIVVKSYEQHGVDVFVGVLTKNIPNKLALIGLRPGLLSEVPSGLGVTDRPCSFFFPTRNAL